MRDRAENAGEEEFGWVDRLFAGSGGAEWGVW